MSDTVNPTIEEIKEKILPILQRHGATRAGLFGSVARGEQRGDSDVDVLVELDRRLSLIAVVGVNREMEEVLGRKVDLVEYDAIKPRIRERILAEEIRIL